MCPKNDECPTWDCQLTREQKVDPEMDISGPVFYQDDF